MRGGHWSTLSPGPAGVTGGRIEYLVCAGSAGHILSYSRRAGAGGGFSGSNRAHCLQPDPKSAGIRRELSEVVATNRPPDLAGTV